MWYKINSKELPKEEVLALNEYGKTFVGYLQENDNSDNSAWIEIGDGYATMVTSYILISELLKLRKIEEL